MSNNIIEINQNIENVGQISAAYLEAPNSNIQNLYATNNKISINHNLQAPYCSLSAFVNDSWGAIQ
ncbi:MAG: hypothetical protein LBI80_06090 [Endomicrobium sp.]|jgi:hypothetical protein|nr:hypothetical protein [Endomicrobium sp.]